MYKEIVICIVVVISIVSLNWYIQDYTKNSVTTISDGLYILKDDLKEGNEDIISEKMKSLHEKWDENYKSLAIFIEHDELEKVETELTSLNAHIEVEEYEEGVPELEKSIFILNHIKDKFRFDVKNIF